jgi:hypothetical protein
MPVAAVEVFTLATRQDPVEQAEADQEAQAM